MTPALHKTAYNRAKTPRVVSPERSEPRKRSLEGCAFAPVGGALASFIGERARGDARPDSDWDVLILLDKDRITRSDMDEVSYPVCEFGWGADMMVNPIMYTIRDWDARRGTPFYKNVMRDGIPLWT